MIGSVVVLVCVLGGFMMSGGSLLLLWHPLEIVVIIGAALGAFMTSNPLKVVKASFAAPSACFKKPRYERSGLRRHAEAGLRPAGEVAQGRPAGDRGGHRGSGQERGVLEVPEASSPTTT
jgi:hypothetical protein